MSEVDVNLRDGFKAAMRMLLGTDEAMGHPSSRAESERRFNDVLEKIDGFKQSTSALEEVPVRSIGEALEKITGRRRVG